MFLETNIIIPKKLDDYLLINQISGRFIETQESLELQDKNDLSKGGIAYCRLTVSDYKRTLNHLEWLYFHLVPGAILEFQHWFLGIFLEDQGQYSAFLEWTKRHSDITLIEITDLISFTDRNMSKWFIFKKKEVYRGWSE